MIFLIHQVRQKRRHLVWALTLADPTMGPSRETRRIRRASKCKQPEGGDIPPAKIAVLVHSPGIIEGREWAGCRGIGWDQDLPFFSLGFAESVWFCDSGSQLQGQRQQPVIPSSFKLWNVYAISVAVYKWRMS
ncbi:uncharacterized protein BO72DRAFT_215478 [Aspergillus fijiensis CBS 313.89]|uniref:Uncharacterized protein n=1 Tax=Aspergillus fijiensis CBS 313.89 TaxID=1448319 RepID=A0A8G1RP63_9EURO|nr:uncharacterized protein BO72DRAFT_215478 [Aspergillus fijiensis CBS 313.89]RAK74106.1 hypothetical protein BO72DRAFT_215478 [Aspergillus fijiensis CBS 313.89]